MRDVEKPREMLLLIIAVYCFILHVGSDEVCNSVL